MALDVDIIKQLEKWLRIELVRFDMKHVGGTINGYVADAQNHVVGINLYAVNSITNYLFLKDLKFLTALNLNVNGISDFSFLEGMEGLTQLHLSHNRITDISFLRGLKHLVQLTLFDNLITDIGVLKELPHLKSADLRNNRISCLPEDIADYGLSIKLQKEYASGLYLGGNPIEIPPMEIVAKGDNAVKAYFHSITRNGARRALNEARVFLVGEGGGGKTSLVNRLMGRPFDQTQEKTQGVSIKYWEMRPGTEKIKVHFWDFGDNDNTYSAQKMFFAKHSLYVLVIDGRRYEKSEYWFKYLRCLDRNGPLLVVLNKMDKNPFAALNRKLLKQKYPNILGFYPLSCVTGEGVREFSEALSQQLAGMNMARGVLGLPWHNVKKRLEALDKQVISRAEFEAICAEEQITTDYERDTLVDYLDQLGLILHFEHFKPDDAYLVKVEWLTGALYRIFHSPPTVTAGGLLRMEVMAKVLEKKQAADFEYSGGRLKYLVDLMLKYELCAAVDEETILIPDLLGLEEPEFEFESGGGLHYVVQYDFLPRCLMSRFLVKMNLQVKDGLQWRTGAVLESKVDNCTALVKADTEGGTVTIRIQGDKRRHYFKHIIFHLREINKGFPNLKATEKIPLPDRPELSVGRAHLEWLDRNGTAHYAPDGAENDYHVKTLLAGIDMDTHVQLVVQLKIDFQALMKLPPQQRGFKFEAFLNHFFEILNITLLDRFIDSNGQKRGTLKMGRDVFLVAAGWGVRKMGAADIKTFASNVAQKSSWAMGVLINLAGFEDVPLNAFPNGHESPIIGIDAQDLEEILDRKVTFHETIEKKLVYATQTERFFRSVKELN